MEQNGQYFRSVYQTYLKINDCLRCNVINKARNFKISNYLVLLMNTHNQFELNH